MRMILAAAAALTVSTAPLVALAAPTPADLATAAAIRDRAAAGSGAYQVVESLTTEVGQRLAGSAAEARARDWAVAKMRAMGLANVHVEPFMIDGWERGVETAVLTGPVRQVIAVTALGHSGATPAAGIDAELIAFDSMAALREADPARVRGRIVFVTHRMAATQDGSSYGAFNAIRTRAPAVASRMGAAAIVIRSLGTDHHRLPHTGVTIWNDDSAGASGAAKRTPSPATDGAAARPIPAAAMSVPDSELIERLLARGGPVRMHLVLTPRFTGRVPSGNVVGEIVGRERPGDVVLVGGHLDSWDLGQGAIDDGTGIAVSFATVDAIRRQGVPRRTVRLVAFGSEETGLEGGIAYAKTHGADRHIVVAEQDTGTGRVWKMMSRVSAAAQPGVERAARLLLPLGIPYAGNAGGYESDLGPLEALHVPVFEFAQDASGYFALHHTADDTLDKVDAAALDQNVAAYAAMLWVVADGTDELGPAEGER